MQSASSGHFVVYDDHSHSGGGTGLTDSSAFPGARMTIFRGQRLETTSLFIGDQILRTNGTSTRPRVIVVRTSRYNDPLNVLEPEVRQRLSLNVPCEATFEFLADHHPRSLAKLINCAQLSPADLTFAAEAMGRCADSQLVRATLLELLSHASAVVREGAIYGLANHLDENVRAFLTRLAAEDASAAVREVARDTLEQA